VGSFGVAITRYPGAPLASNCSTCFARSLLPGTVGIGIADRLRAESHRVGLDVQIIAISTQAEPEHSELFDGYLVKPVDISALDALLIDLQ
jgi:CheY-like chemotaxis protein